MEKEKGAAPAAPVKSGYSWPIPPFFRSDSEINTGADQCHVELMNGLALTGRLTSFHPREASISVVTADDADPRLIEMDEVRMLRLARPLSLVHDAEVIDGLGVDQEQLPDERMFTVRFRDGKTFSGTTCGFIKQSGGLFLYLVDVAPEKAVCCYIPAAQMDDIQVGPLLGDALTTRHSVSEKAVATAVEKQARIRQEKLGEQLLGRGIVSAEDLTQVLKDQSNRPSMKLGDLLVETGLVTADELAYALRLQQQNRARRLGDILIEMGVVTLRLVQVAMSEKLGAPFVDVRGFAIDPQALKMVTHNVASRYQVLPLLLIKNQLVVAVENPLEMNFEQELRFLTGANIVPVIANPEDLRLRIAEAYANVADASDEVRDAGYRPANLSEVTVEDLAFEAARQTRGRDPAKANEFEAGVTDNAIVRLVNKIIIEAHSQGASDIHIESNGSRANSLIRFRIDGELEDYLVLQPSYRNAVISRIKIMAGLDITEHRRAQDGKIAFGRFSALAIELRVAVVPTTNNQEDIVMRLLGIFKPLPLESLGMSPADLDTLKDMVARNNGLILVCGPTGAGKTTTLHSLLHFINRPGVKIWTAEDPVEITQPGLRQVQVNPQVDWTFAAAMRAFLRADPDVIMVGEMRDAETAKIAIEASLTGHLVFSTMHTSSAPESVSRLLDLGMDPFNFADALVGVVSQRLARKLCPKCKKSHVATESELMTLVDEYCAETDSNKVTVLTQWRKKFAVDGHLLLHEAAGCENCRGGYKGRIGIYEVLNASPAVKQLARTRAAVPQIVEAARANGMRLLRQDAIEKVLRGEIDRVGARAAAS